MPTTTACKIEQASCTNMTWHVVQVIIAILVFAATPIS